MSDPMTPKTDSAAFAEAWDAPQKSALAQAEIDRMTDDIIEALKSVFDPEIPVDIYELGLIYKVDLSDDRDVVVEMTLTAPGCPVAGEMPGWVEDAVMEIPGLKSCTVDLVFDALSTMFAEGGARIYGDLIVAARAS
jgi:FeS assembly SUF system protein